MLATHSQIISQLGLAAGETGASVCTCSSWSGGCWRAPSSGSSENFTFHPGPGARSGTSQPASHAAGHRAGDMELLCVTVNTVSCQDSSRDEDAGDAASGHLLLCLKLIFIPLWNVKQIFMTHRKQFVIDKLLHIHAPISRWLRIRFSFFLNG